MPRLRALSCALALATLPALPACSRAPAEPAAASSGSAATPAPSPAVPPLLWDAPSGWARLDVSGGGPRKAAYRVESADQNAEDAEATVFFFGTGSGGDPARAFKEWFAQFDGDVGATAVRESFQAHGLPVETVEVAGTYKVGLTRPPRGRKQSPVQMVKNNWRLYGAVVHTPDRGNWFFRLAGPEDAVKAARSAFRSMLETAR